MPKFLIRTKHFLRPIYRFLFDYNKGLITKIYVFFHDKRLFKEIKVKESGKLIFKIYDYGKITRMRAATFFQKEPETIRWIKTFNKNDRLIDIGANIGIYSLYSATKGIDVVSIEPDSLNYALLNLNIKLNDLGKKVTPYSIAIHDEEKFSKFFIKFALWGGALNSFDNTLDYLGKNFTPIHSQGVYGMTLDLMIEEINFVPNHLKIDVDGNEFLILKGAKNCLNSSALKSILIELDETREDYQESISIIENAGFKLVETGTKIPGKFFTTYNHIFKK